MTGSGAPHPGWRALGATALLMPGAVAAHSWAGGQLPSAPSLVGLTALLLVASLLALRWDAETRLLLPAVAAGQGLLHSSFVALDGPGATHAHHAAETAAAHSPWTGRMLVAHLAVSLLTAAVWRLCARAAHVVLRVVRVLMFVRPTDRAAARTAGSRWLPRLASCLDTAPTRGPPAVTGHA